MFLASLLAFGLGVVFAWAAVAKIANPTNWWRALAGYRLPSPLRAVVSGAVPLVEGGISALFFLGVTRVAAAVTLTMTALFCLVILRARALRGPRLPCGCFGSSKERDYRSLIGRNTVLAMAAGALLLYGRDVRGYPSAPSGAAWAAAVLAVVGLVLLVWLVVAVRSGLRKGAT